MAELMAEWVAAVGVAQCLDEKLGWRLVIIQGGNCRPLKLRPRVGPYSPVFTCLGSLTKPCETKTGTLSIPWLLLGPLRLSPQRISLAGGKTPAEPAPKNQPQPSCKVRSLHRTQESCWGVILGLKGLRVSGLKCFRA